MATPHPIKADSIVPQFKRGELPEQTEPCEETGLVCGPEYVLDEVDDAWCARCGSCMM
jgi:hypothetical protein